MSISVGTLVTIKNTTLTGTSTGACVDDDGNYQVRVAYTDHDGVSQERFFFEHQLEV